MKALILLTIFTINLYASDQFSKALTKIKNENKLPGLAAAYYENGSLKEIASVGIRKIGFTQKIQTEDKFHLGSCTKAMTATLAAVFVEKGILNWDSKLKSLLPDLEIHSGYDNVTFQMLLAHRSGLTSNIGWGDLWKAISDPEIKPEDGRALVAKTLLAKEPEVEPGSKWHYSNAGYITAGYILEKLTGKTFEILLTQELFEPLNMNSCGFGPASSPLQLEPLQPWGHYTNDKKELVPLHKDNPTAYAPAGAVHCSLKDWSKFLQIHLDGFNGKESIIGVDTFKKLHTAYPAQKSEYTYGGWGITKREWGGGVVLTHGGSNTLNSVSVWLAPKKNAALMAASNLQAYKAVDEAIGLLIDRHLSLDITEVDPDL